MGRLTVVCISVVIVEALLDELPQVGWRSDGFGVLVDSHWVPPFQKGLHEWQKGKEIHGNNS